MGSREEQPLLAEAQDATLSLDEFEQAAQKAGKAPERTATEWEDPDDTAGLLDEDGAEPAHSVYKAEVEAQLVAEGGSPLDPREVMKQALLCGTLIGISIYESVFKIKAVRSAEFDLTSVMIMQSVVSIAIGLALTVKNGELKVLLGQDGLLPGKPFFLNILKFAPPGVLFAAAAYVSMIAMVYLAADVFKVLEQTRLLVMGVLGFLIMRKRLSTSSWIALVAVTLTCLTYGRVKTAESNHVTLLREVGKNVVRSEHLEMHFQLPSDEPSNMAAVEEMQRMAHDLRRSHADEAHELVESLKQLATGQSINSSKNPALGFALTAIFVLMSCFAAVYCEIVLKKEKHVPFYIQKIFLEATGVPFAVLLTYCVRPLLVKNHIAEKKLAISFADKGLFYGWDNWLVPLLFVFFIAKSWLSGIICKQLSAISKQLCSITSVCVLYFFMLIHDCENGDFVCPGGISKASFNIIIIDLAVMTAVISYTTALRDKKRKQMYKQQLAGLE